MALTVSLATWDHDRVAAIHDGRVGVPGVEIEGHILPTSQLFPIAVQEARFDITELSISSHLLQVSRGTSAYTAIPAFVSRAFRHGGFFARAGSGITGPAGLAGRTVGVPEYQMTAALWMRGILADDYGVDLASIRWRTGALDEGVRRERLELDLPPGMVVEPIAAGETLQELLLAGSIDALLAIRDLHQRHGHIQEVIIQNFRAKPDTAMASVTDPTSDELRWTVAAARLILGGGMNLQVPPNLNAGNYQVYLDAGINDWGGVSPLTIDYVNPEAPWPALRELRDRSADMGFELKPRLPVYPEFLDFGAGHLADDFHQKLSSLTDENGYVIGGIERYAGTRNGRHPG